MGNETHDGKKGGLLKGKRHYDKDGKPLGGIKAIVTDTGQQVELEGGEVIINREASKKHWKELSRINQSAGGGVPILPPDTVEADTEEYKRGGAIIDFNPNVLPSKWVYDYAKKIKANYPKVWKQYANVYGNEAFENLGGALKRGYWLDGEEWFYYKWKAFNTKHKGSSTLKDVIAALKWCTINSRGWAYMKSVIEAEIKKQYPKAEKLAKGKKVEEIKAKTEDEWYGLMRKDNNEHNKNAHPDDVLPFWEWVSEMGAMYGFKPVKDDAGDTIIVRTQDNPPNEEELEEYFKNNKGYYENEDGDLDENGVEELADDIAKWFNITFSDAYAYIDNMPFRAKNGGNLEEFVPKQKYIVIDKEFNLKRIAIYIGLFTKKGTYHKFKDITKGATFNIHPSHLNHYEIVKAMKDGGNTEIITPKNKNFVTPTFVTRNSVKLLNVAVDNTDVVEINSLLKSVGVPFKVTKELGTGASGTAFLTNRKTVLKVTNESAEAYTSYIISISNFKNQAKVHNVFKITDGTRSMYFIEKELVKVADSMQKNEPFPLDNLFLEAFSTGSSRVKEHYTDKEIVEVANDYYTEWIELFENKNGEKREFTKDEVVGIKELKSKKKYIVEKLYNLFTFYRDIEKEEEEQDLDYNDVHAGNFGEVNGKFVCFDCISGGEKSFMLGGELAKGIEVENEHKGTLEKLYKHQITPQQAPKQIAKDHLKEDKKYYTKLDEMESKFAGGGTLKSFGLENLKVGDKGIFNGLQTTVANITDDKIYFTQGGGKTQYKRSYDTFAKNWNPISGKPSQQNTTTNSYNVGDYFRIDDWDGGTYATITAIEKEGADGDYVVYYNYYEFPSKREQKGDLGRRLFDKWVGTNEIIFLPKTYRNLWYKKGDTLVGNGSERLVHDIHTGTTYLQTPNADIRDVATKHVFERLENGDWKIQFTSLIEKPQIEKPITDVSYTIKTPTGEPSKLTYIQQMLVRTSAFKEFFGDWEDAAKKYIANPIGGFNTFYHNISKSIDLITLEPRIMYHGTRTNEEFFVFDADVKDIGRPYAYFARNKEYAQQFTNFSQRGSGNTPVLYECFLNIRKPFMAVGIDFEIVEKKADYWLGKFAETILFDKHGLNKEDGAKTYEKIHKVVVSQIGKYAEKLCGDTDVPFWRFMSDDKKSVFKVFLMSHNYDSIEYGERIAPNIDYNNPKEYTMATTIFDSTQTKLGDGRNLDFDKLNPDIRFKDGGNLSAQANDKAEGSTNAPEQTNNANITHKDKLGKVIFGDKYEHGGVFKGHTNNPINDDRAYVENLITKMKN
jgi:hypothetical protein